MKILNGNFPIVSLLNIVFLNWCACFFFVRFNNPAFHRHSTWRRFEAKQKLRNNTWQGLWNLLSLLWENFSHRAWNWVDDKCSHRQCLRYDMSKCFARKKNRAVQSERLDEVGKCIFWSSIKTGWNTPAAHFNFNISRSRWNWGLADNENWGLGCQEEFSWNQQLTWISNSEQILRKTWHFLFNEDSYWLDVIVLGYLRILREKVLYRFGVSSEQITRLS